MEIKAKWNKSGKNLLKTILGLHSLSEAEQFFRDLLTEKEITEISNRWLVAQMLENNISFSKIRRTTGLSPNTIARINRWRRKGMGGYSAVLKKSSP
jgi:TrpR-related protein YerC/YecD